MLLQFLPAGNFAKAPGCFEAWQQFRSV